MSDNDLRVAAQGLRDEAAGISQDVKDLRVYGIRNRHLIRVVFISLALDLTLTIGLAWNAVRTQAAIKRAQRAQTSLVAACVASNVVRRADTDLWNFVLTLPPSPGQPPAAPGVLDQFKKVLSIDFAPEDCGKVK
jgi:hypothetical protein